MPVEITFSIFILKHKNKFLNTNFFDFCNCNFYCEKVNSIKDAYCFIFNAENAHKYGINYFT